MSRLVAPTFFWVLGSRNFDYDATASLISCSINGKDMARLPATSTWWAERPCGSEGHGRKISAWSRDHEPPPTDWWLGFGAEPVSESVVRLNL